VTRSADPSKPSNHEDPDMSEHSNNPNAPTTHDDWTEAAAEACSEAVRLERNDITAWAAESARELAAQTLTTANMALEAGS
jgi:hypothetical protein